MFRWKIYSWVIGLFCLLGCGQGSGPQMGTVTGVVTLDGAPLADAAISFTPEQGGRPSSGITDSEGRYKLEYSSSQNGALLGSHMVHISTEREGGNTGGEGQAVTLPVKEKVPDKYRESGALTVTVKAGRNRLDFPLTSN